MLILLAGGFEAYHRNPSLQCVIIFIFLPIVGFEDEFLVELRKGYAGISVEFFQILGKAGSGGWEIILGLGHLLLLGNLYFAD